MNQEPQSSRRTFIKNSSAAVIGGAFATSFAFPQRGFAENSETIKIGLVGCGGRGSGAAINALNSDKNVVLHSMGDAFKDKLESSLASMKKQANVSERVKVDPDHQFSGLDAYQKVIDSGVDVVLLATPPAFRPVHLKACVAANKHVFCEKPIATDAPGYRSVLETVAESKRKKLALGSGFCWRSNLAERAIYDKILGGDIGEVRTIYGTYNTNATRGALPHDPKWSPLEAQMRNWMYYTWLSGDHIVEQAVHNVDLTNWAMNNKMPTKCVAHGGRQNRSENMIGNIFDHFSVVYDWDNGVKGFLFCRQQNGCANDNTETVYGTKGTARVMLFNGQSYTTDLAGKQTWKYPGKAMEPNMYVVEHEELYASIRAGKPRNDGEALANSSMMAIMGRMAGYSGQEITWEQAINSKEVLVPEKLDWNIAPPIPEIAMPGKTPFI